MQKSSKTRYPRYLCKRGNQFSFQPRGLLAEKLGFTSRSLGTDEALACAEAWSYLHQAEHMATPTTSRTFRELSTHWLTHHNCGAASTQANRRLHIGFWQSKFGAISPQLIKQDHIRTALQTSTLAEGSRAVYKDTLSLLFGWFIETGETESNPCLHLRLPRSKAEPSPLLPEHRAKLLHTAERMGMDGMADAIVLADACGFRRSDILALRWDNIDSNRISLRMIKTGKVISQPIVPQVRDRLSQIRRRSVVGLRIILREGEPYSTSQFVYDWDKVRKQAELPEARFHQLRHSFASDLRVQGRSVDEIAAALGDTTQAALRYFATPETFADEAILAVKGNR